MSATMVVRLLDQEEAPLVRMRREAEKKAAAERRAEEERDRKVLESRHKSETRSPAPARIYSYD